MGTYDGGRLAVGHRRIRSRPDLRSTRVTPCLPTILDRDIDTLLPCSGLAPLARRPGCVTGDRAVGKFYRIELFIDWE